MLLVPLQLVIAPFFMVEVQEEEVYMRGVITFQSLTVILNPIVQLKAEQFSHIVKVLSYRRLV